MSNLMHNKGQAQKKWWQRWKSVVQINGQHMVKQWKT